MCRSKFVPFQCLILLLIILGPGVGCFKGDDREPISPQQQLEMDIKAIDAYLEVNQISATAHSSGLRYLIRMDGNEVRATPNDRITVNYEGKFMFNGLIFDSQEGVEFLMSDLIEGWQIGIPLIGEGGSITLYVPSGFAYGTFGVPGIVPPDANLIFDIDLIDVK